MFESLPPERRDRWELMRSIIALWMRPLTEADFISQSRLDQAEQRLGRRLPTALREWYQLAGAAEDIWCCQDRLLAPEKARVLGDVLVFCVENQSCWGMGARLDAGEVDDAPVVGWTWSDPWEFTALNTSVSECALQYLAWAMKWANHYPRFACHLANPFSGSWDFGWWKPDTLAAIKRSCVRCDFPAWPLVGYAWEFYARQDLLIQLGHGREGGGPDYLYASPRTAEALATFEGMVRETGFQWASGRWYS